MIVAPRSLRNRVAAIYALLIAANGAAWAVFCRRSGSGYTSSPGGDSSVPSTPRVPRPASYG